MGIGNLRVDPSISSRTREDNCRKNAEKHGEEGSTKRVNDHTIGYDLVFWKKEKTKRKHL